MFFRTKSGQQHLSHTTSSWSLLILHKDGEEEWIPLNRLKKFLPLETAKFVVSIGIDDEPAFKWWVHCDLSRRHRIVPGVNKRTRRVTQKHGIELSTLVSQAKKLDEKNGNALWMDVTNREPENLKVAFDGLEDEAKIPFGHDKTSSQLVFDVQMTLEHKDTWVKHLHRIPEP